MYFHVTALTGVFCLNPNGKSKMENFKTKVQIERLISNRFCATALKWLKKNRFRYTSRSNVNFLLFLRNCLFVLLWLKLICLHLHFQVLKTNILITFISCLLGQNYMTQMSHLFNPNDRLAVSSNLRFSLVKKQNKVNFRPPTENVSNFSSFYFEMSAVVWVICCPSHITISVKINLT